MVQISIVQRALRVFAAVFILAVGSPAFAQVQLPDGLGKEVAERLCSVCHEAERAASVRLTREGWEGELAKMVDLGMKATDEEMKQLLDYLSEHFKGEASKPINLNSATAVELESVAALLRKEAAAWIAYRAKTPCKTLDDLKKVPGVPFKKIDDRRDRLVCF
jgi:isocitrate/isopropylmalate dehydrogenase